MLAHVSAPFYWKYKIEREVRDLETVFEWQDDYLSIIQ